MGFLQRNVGWIGLVLSLAAGAAGLYAKAALAETKERQALIEQRINDHMELQQRRDRLIMQKLDALCRVTPNAQCPLGVE